MSRACYVDNDGCLVCPELPAVDGVPARLERGPNLGWNAGANSVDAFGGDLSTSDDVSLTFTMPSPVVGVVLGLKSSRERVGSPAAITHGWYFFTQAGHAIAWPMEHGAPVGDPLTDYFDDAQFEVRRVLSHVEYRVTMGEQMDALHYRSTRSSHGFACAGVCLYAAGDAVPSSGTAAPTPSPPPGGGGEL